MARISSVLLTLVIATPALISAFDIESVSPIQATVDEGGDITLECKVDGYFEWCTFRHNDKLCDFEWKRSIWDITVLECDDYEDRMKSIGVYDDYHCGIRLSNVTLEDAGKWTCHLESYHSGYYRGYGYNATGTMNLEVTPKTTTTTTTTPTTTTTVTVTTTKTTSSSVPEYYDEDDDDYVPSEDASDADSSKQTGDEVINDDDDDVVEEGSPIIYIVVAICLIILIATALILFGLHYKRKLPPSFYVWGAKRRFKPVMGTEDFPVTEEDEAKHPSIVKNGTNGSPVKSDQEQPNEMNPMSDSANINPSLTTVTWNQSEKEAQAALVDAAQESENQEEKKDQEKDTEEDKEPTEDQPLQDEDNLNK